MELSFFHTIMYMAAQLASLILGLLAWIFPMILIVHYKKMSERKWLTLFGGSLSACAISLWMRIMMTFSRVQAGDFSALEDFYYVIAFAVSVLLAVTMFLNAFALYLYLKNRGK